MKKSLHNPKELKQLVDVLEYQDSVKKDLVLDSAKHLHFIGGQLVLLDGKKKIKLNPTEHFHTQVAEKFDIPRGYYKKMLADATKLLDSNVNHWLKSESKNLLLRTFQGGADYYKSTARALLSDRYSMIDNYAVLMEALEAIKETGLKIEVVNAELSETRMYLKVVCPDVEIKAKELLYMNRQSVDLGVGVISGFTLSNSEIGAGSFKITPRGVVLACTNGLISTKDELKNIHLGSKMEQLGFDKNKDVMRANLKLIREQIKHAVKIFLSKEYLKKLIDVYKQLGDKPIEAQIEKVIQVVGKEYQISDERKSSILKYFIEGGDTRRMGLASAMTREVQDLQNADQKHETEVASFDMLNNFDAIEKAAFKIKISAS